MDTWSRPLKGIVYVDGNGYPGPPRELYELDLALRILCRETKVDAGALSEIYQLRQSFVDITTGLYDDIDSSIDDYWPELDGADWPCFYGLIEMAGYCERLILEPESLQLWARCGAALGKCQYIDEGRPDFWPESDNEPIDVLKETLHAILESEPYPSIKKYMARLKSIRLKSIRFVKYQEDTSSVASFEARSPDLPELDRTITKTLWRKAPAEVYLDLDEDRLIFFRSTYYIGKLPAGKKAERFAGKLTKAEAALLWVLAEHLGEQVDRETIRSNRHYICSPHYIQSSVSRLRKLLRPAYAAYCARRGSEPPPAGFDCFIKGVRGEVKGESARTSYRGPYTLDLGPERVRLSSVKPEWTKPRHTQADPSSSVS
jgi:hypothetical protein